MAPLKIVIRSCMLYEFKLGTNATQTTRKICQAFGKGSVNERTAQFWFSKFSRGDDSLEDAPRPGRPEVIDNEELKAEIELDTKQSCQVLAERFNVSDETIRLHLHQLGRTFKLSQWVPHELTADNKIQRLSICSSLLSRHNNAPFLDRMLTCDEKWVLYSNPKRSRHWLSSTDPIPQTSKPRLHQQKVLLSVWWTTAGIVHYELLPSGQTITGEVYSAQLQRVHAALKKKQPALVNRKGVVFLQDNARPHTARVTLEKLKSLEWEILPHPPYSPDISPSDYHLFLSLDNHLRNRHFRNRDAIEKELDSFFSSKNKEFYKKGIYKLPSRWEKVVECDGNYFNE